MELIDSTPSVTTTASDGGMSLPLWAVTPIWASSLALVANMRTGPTPSLSDGCWRCGSHLTHCHAGCWALDAATMRATSPGACQVTSWATIE